MASDRDVAKIYELPDFVAELRRLADALEAGNQFQIEIEGEDVLIPEHATVSIEHEREDGREEIEFQLIWDAGEPDDLEEEDEEDDDEVESEETGGEAAA